MLEQERDGGKFSFKGSTPRKLRSILLTDYTWKTLDNLASEEDMTRGDYLEAIANNEIELNDSNKESNLDFDVDEIVEILKKALLLKSRQGVMKDELIKEALELMGFEVESD